MNTLPGIQAVESIQSVCDIFNRTEIAVSQAHCFQAIKARVKADRLIYLTPLAASFVENG